MEPRADAFGITYTCHQTIWFYWICPGCQTKVLHTGLPDDEELACGCHICRSVSLVVLRKKKGGKTVDT